MLRGLTAAASGMLADERLQEMLTNNMANAQTPGFKASNGSTAEFPEQLLAAMNYNGGPRTPIGTMGTGTVFQEGVPTFSQGTLQQTGRNLDVALSDATPSGTYAAVAPAGAPATAATTGNPATGAAAGAGTPGTYPVSVNGTVTAGANGILSIGGQPLAVLNSNGTVVPGVYAMKNPAYQGSALYAADGGPDYDSAGHPSYVYANAAGKVIGTPALSQYSGYALRIGNSQDMGQHGFFAVDYTSTQGVKGIALTRNGHFGVNSQHQLVDAAGNPVLPVDAQGKAIPGGRIAINPAYHGTDLFGPNGQPVTDSQGQVSYRVLNAAGTPIPGAHLGSVNADVTQLSPLGAGEFMVGGTLNPTAVLSRLSVGTAAMTPGSLEQSNVDVTSTMAHMIAVVGQYQANQRVIQSIDTELGDAVQKVGYVNL
ncbi:flagellar basal body protein [Alicyclobacillus tolerans]|uniref:flagellar basal body rod C-terminal domain-containing protein n=1 Tax=Alicyclobacillus tolerans TaxID=90970 RepID=UPI001F0290B0|nr:flagellar basal body rod C-terminal domain-containing protein [Alicyclobacillus tolerans]MCF8567185.1 flagellar basal body protein [Alicyclobacillus tolerans]